MGIHGIFAVEKSKLRTPSTQIFTDDKHTYKCGSILAISHWANGALTYVVDKKQLAKKAVVHEMILGRSLITLAVGECSFAVRVEELDVRNFHGLGQVAGGLASFVPSQLPEWVQNKLAKVCYIEMKKLGISVGTGFRILGGRKTIRFKLRPVGDGWMFCADPIDMNNSV